MFNKLQNTITGWPGGKPNADDTKRPERAEPSKKEYLFFSLIQMMMLFLWAELLID